VIVAESNKVTIYDGDTPDLDMWMVFNHTSSGHHMNGLYAIGMSGVGSCTNSDHTSLTAINGSIYIGADTKSGGCTSGRYGNLALIQMLEDTAYLYRNSSDWGGFKNLMKYSGNVVDRNDFGGSVAWAEHNSAVKIVANEVNDVAMTVLPNAPIDSATGLPVPTIAVATDGGVSVIKDDGSVVDWSSLGQSSVSIKDGNLYITYGGNTRLYIDPLPSADVPNYSGGLSNGVVRHYCGSTHGTHADNDLLYNSSTTGDTTRFVHSKDTLDVSTEAGISRIKENTTTPAEGSVAYITSDYNTGYMTGDIKLATLSDTDDTDVTGSELLEQNYSNWILTGATVDTSEFYSSPNSIKSVSNAQIAQSPSFSLVAGQRYTLTFKYKDPAAGTYHHAEYFLYDGNGTTLIKHTWPVADVAGWQTHTYTFTASVTGNMGYLKVFSDDSETIYFDDLSIRLAEEDRSVNGNGLQVFGTVDKDPVATGADLVAYSFSTSSTNNKLSHPYDSNLAFGTGDFSISFWVKSDDYTPNGSGVSFVRSLNEDLVAGKGGISVGSSTVNDLRFQLFTGGNNSSGRIDCIDTTALPTGVWNYIVALRTGATLKLYLNGVLVQTASSSVDVSNLNTDPYDILAYNQSGVEMALLRISATAPTAEQITEIYEAEKPLFQENAKCTLNGTSDAVTALAYDDSTELLHIGTSGGRSTFQGLRRVDETTNNTTEIAAQGGLIVEEY